MLASELEFLRQCGDLRRTAFNWAAYVNRSSALRLLRASKAQADTLVETRDGFADTVHWQVFGALCPRLVAASELEHVAPSGADCDLLPPRWVRVRLRLPPEVDGNLARKLIDCAYGERVLFSAQSLVSFYKLANEYRIAEAVNICLAHATRLVNVRNCVDLFVTATRHRHLRLQRLAYAFIRAHFREVLAANQDFHRLRLAHLRRLLKDDQLNINEQEELVWLAIVRWVRATPISGDALLELYNRMLATAPAGKQPPARAASVQAMIGYHLQTSMNFHTLQAHSDVFGAAPCCSGAPPPSAGGGGGGGGDDDDDFRLLGCSSKASRREPLDEARLCKLLKCLRFLRFRSAAAFGVILDESFVGEHRRLAALVEYMRLRYLIRKRIPFDKQQAQLMLPSGGLARIKRAETSRPQRAYKRALRLVRCAPGLFPGAQPANCGAGPSSGDAGGGEPALSEPLDGDTLRLLGAPCIRSAGEPRVPDSVVLLVGGWQEGAISRSLLAYDFVADRWFKLGVRLPEPRAFHASCGSPLGSQIYILGGTNGVDILDSVLRFDAARDVRPAPPPLSYHFHRMPAMRERRCHLSAVLHSDGQVYALGGHNGGARLRSCERLAADEPGSRWLPIADMILARSCAAACSHDNKIFVAGGQIGDQFIQASVEFYRARDDTWTFAAPMIVPRMSFQLVAHRGHLLALGGINGLMGGEEMNSVTRSVERFEPHRASWSLCAPMLHKRSSFGAVSLPAGSNQLLVVAGQGGRRRTRACESLRVGQLDAGPQRPAQPPPPPLAQRLLQSPRPPRAGVGVPPPPPPAAGTGPAAGHAGNSPRSAMQWQARAPLFAKRNGFSLALVRHLPNARQFTYHGLKSKTPSAIKPPNRWQRFRFIRRRKLVKHLKIALVIALVYLIL